MPITFLDLILLVVMLISAMLAMIRGFMREILSIAAWVIAAVATVYSYGKLLPMAKNYFNNDVVAAAAVIGGVFLGTLLIVSVLTVRISDNDMGKLQAEAKRRNVTIGAVVRNLIREHLQAVILSSSVSVK